MIQQIKNLPAEKRRAVTVQAVIKLAEEWNPYDITTSAIAAMMGLTQGALFRHFLSKDVIWNSVMEWVRSCLLVRIDQAIQSAKSPLAALEAIFMAHLDFVSRHPGVPRILLTELQRTGTTPAKQLAQEFLTEYEQRLCRLIETGKTFGEITPYVSTESATTLFVGTIQGLAVQSIVKDSQKQILSQAAEIFSLYRRGIEVRHETSA